MPSLSRLSQFSTAFLSFSYLAAIPAASEEFNSVDPKKIVDGDTFYVSVRVQGADTPEVGGNAKCDRERSLGERATNRTEELLRDNTVTLRINGVDKHHRLLATVILPDGRDLAEVLIAEELALPYEGGTKPDWCR